MSDKFYDCIVVGSSPSNLMRAVERVRAGETVLLVDNSKYFGGAWHARPVFSNSEKSYEVATHMLSPFIEEYAMLEDAGITLKHRPIIYFDFGATAQGEEIEWLNETFESVYAKRKPGGAHKLSWSQYFSLLDYRSIDDSKYLQARIQMHQAQETQFKYYWPGVIVLINRLLENFKSAGGEILTAATVSDINVSASGVSLKAGKKSYACKSMLAGRHLDATIDINDTPLDLSPKTNYYYSLMVKCKSDAAQPHPYIACAGHSNITAIQQCFPMDGEDTGISVFCLAGSWPNQGDPIAAARSLCREIIANTGFNPDTEIVEASWFNSQMTSLSTATCEDIGEKSEGAITITPVTNFMLDLKNNHEQWAENLKSAV